MTPDHPVTLPPELSPAAQAVWEAFNEDEAGVFVDYGDKLAAALRALANHQTQIVTHGPLDRWTPAERNRRELLRIAAELESAQ